MDMEQVSPANDEAIRRIIREEFDSHEKNRRLDRRSPTIIKDESGAEWYTGALKKADFIKFIVWCVSGIAALVMAGLLAYSRLEIYPEVDRKIAVHSVQSREQMASMAPLYASKPELDGLRKDLEVLRVQLTEQLKAMKEQQDRIEKSVERIHK